MSNLAGGWSSSASTDLERLSRPSAGPRSRHGCARPGCSSSTSSLWPPRRGADRPWSRGRAPSCGRAGKPRTRSSRRSRCGLVSASRGLGQRRAAAHRRRRTGHRAGHRPDTFPRVARCSRTAGGPRRGARELPGGDGGATVIHHAGARTQVTVGWTDNHTAKLALAVAAEEAHLRGIALTVVTVPPEFDPQLVGSSTRRTTSPPSSPLIAALEAHYPRAPDQHHPPERRRKAGAERHWQPPPSSWSSAVITAASRGASEPVRSPRL